MLICIDWLCFQNNFFFRFFSCNSPFSLGHLVQGLQISFPFLEVFSFSGNSEKSYIYPQASFSYVEEENNFIGGNQGLRKVSAPPNIVGMEKTSSKIVEFLLHFGIKSLLNHLEVLPAFKKTNMASVVLVYVRKIVG